MHRPRSFLALLCVVFASLACVPGPVRRLDPGRAPLSSDKWLEATTPHFRVLSDGSESDVRDAAREFERFRAILRTAIGDSADAGEPTVPLTVFAMRTEKDFRILAPEAFEKRTSRLAGLFEHRPYGVDIFVLLGARSEAGGRPGDPGPTIRHEYHHLYFDRTSPWAPTWLREGLADVWATAELDGRTLEFGHMQWRQVIVLRHTPLIPLDRLLKVDNSSPEYREWDRAGVFYAESAIFTHFLIFKQPDGETKLRTFGSLLEKGTPPVEAATEVWGDLAALQRSFEDYFRHNESFPLLRGTLREPIPDVDIAVRPLPAERLTALRAYLLASGPHPALSLPLVESALTRSPDDALALEAKGMDELAAGRTAEARTWLEKAAAEPDARFSALFLASLVAERNDDGTLRNPAAVEAELGRVLDLQPRFAPAMCRLANLRVARDPDAALELAVKAATIEPGAPALELCAARVFLATGRKSDATTLAGRATAHAIRGHNAGVLNNVCWFGALSGFAETVMPACDEAVRLAPRDWTILDSRAVARAVAGDRDGAAADLELVVAQMRSPLVAEKRKQRLRWLADLKAGRDPFDGAALRSLDDSIW